MAQGVDADVIVIGGGLSALIAAYEIQEANISCIVLEARDRVGGKTWSIDPLHEGKIVDVGAAWINDTNQSEVYALAKFLDLELVVQNTTGRVVQEDIDGSLSTFEYGAAPDALSESDGVSEMLRIRALFEETCQKLDIRDLSSADPALDKQTLQQWVELHSTSKTALASASVWTRAMLGLEPSEISALYFLMYCKSGGGLLQMRKDTKDGGQYLRFVKGTQSLSLGLVARLQPDTLRLSHPVTNIIQSALLNSVTDCVITVTTSTSPPKSYTCHRVILSLPTPLYKSIKFDPPLPKAKCALANSNIQGYTNKIILLYKSPWWRAANPPLCGLLQSFTGPITVTRDSSVDIVHQYSLTCFLVGGAGRRLAPASSTERFAAVVEQVNRVFRKFVTVEQPLKVVEYEWTKDEWSGGCPVPVAPPGVTGAYEWALRESFGGVHFVGTETGWEWKGYMDGAVSSGRRGAKEVIEALRS